MTRTRLRIGAVVAFAVASVALLVVWFESTRHSLVLLGPLSGLQIEFLCGLLMLVALAAVILSLGRQLSQREGRRAKLLGDTVIVLTVIGLAAASPVALVLGLGTGLTSYWRLAPSDHGKRIVVDETSWFHSDFGVYRGDGILFDYVEASSAPIMPDPVSVDHWSVSTANGHYVISCATTPNGFSRILFDLS